MSSAAVRSKVVVVVIVVLVVVVVVVVVVVAPIVCGSSVFGICFYAVLGVLSSLRRRESWLLYFNCLLVAFSVLSFFLAVALVGLCDCGISWSYSLTF